MIATPPQGTDSGYLLGHRPSELERLIRQSAFLGELSDHFLRLAGLEAGMHVLDVGCGAGDLSFLAARIVGPGGRVTGIDRSPEAVALATSRAATSGLTTVEFRVADAAGFEPGDLVDAVIGRLVLMYWPDAASVVRRLARLVRPGGVVTFQDYDFEAMRSEPPVPTYELALEWVRQAFAAGGADLHMGVKLGRVFEDAGLPTPRMLAATRFERGPESPAYDQFASVVRTVLPLLIKAGVATADEVGIDTLASRMMEETVARRATLVAPTLVAAWTRKQE